MIKKILIACLLFVNFLQAATLDTTKAIYTPNEQIVVNFTEMTAKNRDWVGIYPLGSTNAWENVLQWQWTEDVSNGNLNFNAMPEGEYEVRSFYNNSFITVAVKQFSVVQEQLLTTVTSDKENYFVGEPIIATYTDMAGNNNDWIAIYPAGSSTAWGNMIQWAWVPGTINGTHTFEALPEGDYEVRVFFNNSAILKASHAFSVIQEDIPVAVTTTKEIYTNMESIIANYENMAGNNNDWIAIYPAGSSTAWGNMIQWAWVPGTINGTHTFEPLPEGEYEVRVFFNNSAILKASHPFKVKEIEDNIPLTTLYEDAENDENGFDQAWFAGDQNFLPVIIDTGAEGSTHAVRVPRSGGSFSFNHPPKKMKYLILDTRIGTASHVGNFGVKVRTTHGTRRILFSSYLNHMGANGGNDFVNPIVVHPFTSHEGYIHNHPGPTDYYLDTRNGNFIHYKINIEEKLQMLEPDNELLEITYFTSAGGDFDNIKLSSH